MLTTKGLGGGGAVLERGKVRLFPSNKTSHIASSRSSVHQGQQKASNKASHVASSRSSMCQGQQKARGQPYLAPSGS